MLFSFGELWGEAPCSICGKMGTFTMLNDDEESYIRSLPSGKIPALVICQEKLGENRCIDCASEEYYFNREKHK